MREAPTPVQRAIKYGWAPLVALAATQMLEQGERQSLAQAVDGIQKTFHVSKTAVSFLPTAMGIVAIAGAIPLGILADRVRRTWLLAGAMAIWTVCMGLNGLATTYVFLFVARMGVGMVEANGSAATSLLSDYYPVRDRARMFGLYQSGALVGAIIGLVGGGFAVKYGGFRWAFLFWIPLGIATVLYLMRQPEPVRGHQDRDFGDDLDAVNPGGIDVGGLSELRALLPEPRRVGTLDYATATPREVGRELMRIPSMWFGVLSLCIGQMLLNGLQFWGVDYFKEVHGLDPAGAGALTGLLGAGSVVGILGGGFLSDRYLRRGVINARVYVIAFGSIAATLVLMPAFAATSLWVTAPLMVLGGVFLTLPVAPAEAMVSDVVVAQLRGRASAVRTIVRTVSVAGYVIIGVLADQIGLRWALVWTTPLYAVGGVLALFATRHYPHDLAFVVAESRRRPDGGADQ
ncbi:MAG: transporter [Acidimicrobiales bacterium]|nr:transporter [Acidimicrobiales bacterium]